LLESTLALLSFAVLLGGIMELGFTGMVSNTLAFAAQRAARYASVRGASSGHAASLSDVQGVAQEYASPLNTGSMTVAVTWIPDKNPGSTVEVVTSYSFRPAILPLSGSPLTLKWTARQTVVQ
jgi:Flp pilus assembly protein TadG